MKNARIPLIIAGLLGASLLYAARDYLSLILILGIKVLIYIAPIVIIIGIVIFAKRRLDAASQQKRGVLRQQPPARYARQPATPLRPRLQSAFRRNHTADLDRALATLPAWPISQQLQTTTHGLLALNQSIYRAQAEGVPVSMIQRYLSNTQQASERIWDLASKLEALGQQPVTYELIAPRLQEEEAHLAQLQHSAQAAQDGIALLIVSGMQSGAFQQSDEDLSALTAAVKRLISPIYSVDDALSVKH